MARPERHDADYFPFYARDGKTLFILESKYQCKGTGFFTNVMRLLTLQKDHYFCIKEPEDRLYFFSKTKCDEESGTDMLNLMAVTGKIDKDLWVSSAVIVSQDLLTSLLDAYRKRINKIITISEIKEKYVSGGVETVSGGSYPQESDVSGGNKPQRKGKERKGKERKVKYLDHVFLSETEYGKLKEVLGQKSLEAGIEKLDLSISNGNGKYKDHYKTLLNWHSRGFIVEYMKNHAQYGQQNPIISKPTEGIINKPKEPQFYEHENPDPEKIKQVNELVKNLTAQIGGMNK